jgi:predicted alpha/beta-fold hydrolase
MVRTEHGGHLGFMFHQVKTDVNPEAIKVSFMPGELARFIRHVYDSRLDLEKANQ